MVSSILSRKKSYPLTCLSAKEGDLVSYLVSFYDVFVCELGYRHSSQQLYPWIPLWLGIFYTQRMEVGRVFVKQLDPLGYFILGRTIHPFEGGAIKSRSTPFIESGDGI